MKPQKLTTDDTEKESFFQELFIFTKNTTTKTSFFVIPASGARRESVFQARQTADSGQAGMTDINRKCGFTHVCLSKCYLSVLCG
jgi:hypothetical protein